MEGNFESDLPICHYCSWNKIFFYRTMSRTPVAIFHLLNSIYCACASPAHGDRRSYLENGNYGGKTNIARAHGRFGIYEVKPMKVMPPWKKGKKIRRGWVSPKKRRKNARGESRHTPDFLRGCVGGANRGVIFFCIYKDRLTRKNPFLLVGKEGTGRRKGGKETQRDSGRRKEGKEPNKGMGHSRSPRNG